MTKPSPFLAGFLQAASIALYAILFATFIETAPRIESYGPVLVLLLFCFSALFCTSAVCVYPIWLILNQRKKEAIMVVIATVVSLGLITFATIFTMLITVPVAAQ